MLSAGAERSLKSRNVLRAQFIGRCRETDRIARGRTMASCQIRLASMTQSKANIDETGSYCGAKKDLITILQDLPLFQPIRQRRQFAFTYDPQANNGIGRCTLRLEGKSFVLDLTPEMRKVEL
jgi:hypothetical protein